MIILTRLGILLSLIFFLGCSASEFDLSGDLDAGGALGVDDGNNGNNGNTGDNESDGNTTPSFSALDILKRSGSANTIGQATNSTQLVSELCNQRSRSQKSINIEFDPPAKSCGWGVNGNLEPRNFFFQARREQVVELDLPEGAVICDMDFNFPSEQFFYDDQFILSLNDTVLTSSFNYSPYFNGGDNGLTLYNWSQIAGTNWQFDLTDQYCATLPGVTSTCNFPDSSDSGVSDMEFEKEHIVTAMANGVPLQGNHFFRLSTIGDNDEADCSHAGLNFNISVDYVK